MSAASARALARWLLACAALAACVLLVGGVTRMTQSGLSIVQWQPIEGVVPPLDDTQWAAAFEQYRGSPQYRLVNSGMTLAAFKTIFWWEYAHRLLARVAGLAFVAPLAWLLLARRVRGALAWRLAGIGALGALQGVLGWAMVASGLVDNPRVSPLRLAAHLALGLLLVAALLWTAWSLRAAASGRRGAPRVPPFAALAVAATFVMALSGALVAATHAGYLFNTFPLMDGAIAPPGLLALSPWYVNLVDNPALIQLVHRALAFAVTLAVGAAWLAARRGPARARGAAGLMVLALLVQLMLGVATLLTHVWLPLAVAHQMGALALLASALRHAFVQSRPVPGALPESESEQAAQPRSSGPAIAAPSSSAR